MSTTAYVRSSARLAAGLAIVTVVAACADDAAFVAPDPLGLPRPEAQVTRDTTALAAFLTNEGKLPIVFDVPPAARVEGQASLEDDIELELESSVAPPVVGGQTLEATDVAFSEGNGNERYAYVAYSKRGEATLGAIDAIRISSRSNPKLESRVTFTDTDVFAVAVSGGRLYLAGMTADPSFRERAVLEVVELDRSGGLPAVWAARRIQLPSFAGTAVHVQNNKVWVTSGTGGPNTGGLSVFDARTLSLLVQHRLDDARGVHGDSATGVVVVTQGTPGRTTVYSHDTNQRLGDVVATGGATIPEARGDVKVAGAWAFVAASNGGTRVLQVGRSGASMRGNGIARPVVAGLDSTLSTVNGVALVNTTRTAWVFTANGEAGVYGYFSNHPAVTGVALPSISLMGRLSFPRSISANFIRIDRDNSYMFVASGLGGLRIVEID